MTGIDFFFYCLGVGFLSTLYFIFKVLDLWVKQITEKESNETRNK
jgi:hypothetical protein